MIGKLKDIISDIIKIKPITVNGGKISMEFPAKIPNIFAPNSKVFLALLELSELSWVSQMAIENLKQRSQTWWQGLSRIPL